MKKLLLLLTMLIIGIGSMWATPTTVTVINSTNDATTYGSLSGTTFTTNAASGMAGVTVEGVNYAAKVNNTYGYCLGCTVVSSGTVTMTAPEGYVIMGYSLTGRLNTSNFVFTLTPSAGGSAVALTTGGQSVSASGLDAQTASFTYAVTTNNTQESTNTFYMPSLVITIGTAEEAAFAKSQIEAYNTVQGWVTTIQGAQGLVKEASNYVSNAKSTAEGSYEALLDGNYSTYFHGAYGSQSVPNEDQYLQATLSEATNAIYFYFKKRSQNNANRPTSITIYGSNDNSAYTEITTINSGLPTNASDLDYTSSKINLGASYQYLRFTVTATNTGATHSNGHVFFTFSEFYILPSNSDVDDVMDLRATLASTAAADYTAQNISDVTAANTALLSTMVEVTYALYESDGTTFVSNTVVEQLKNSAISLPTAISNYTYYDYATEGTIGTEDVTIKVTRTLKTGYVINLAGLSNSKCYNIRNNRGTWAVGSGTTVVNSTTELGLAFSASDVKQQFAFIAYEDNVYLYSVGEGKFAYVDGTKLSLTADVTNAVAASPVTFQASTNATYKYSEPIIVTVAGNHFGISTGFSPNVYKYNSQGDGGNCAYVIEAGNFNATSALAALEAYFHPTVTYIVKDGSDNTLFTSDPVETTNGANITTLPAEYQRSAFYTYNTVDVTISASGNTDIEFTATPKDDAPVRYTADATNPYYYNLSIRSMYLVYDDDAIGDVTLSSESEPFNDDASWAFIGNPYGFKVINKTKGTDYFLTYTSVVTGGNSGSDGSNNNVQFVASEDFNNRYWIIETNSGGFCMRMRENTNIYFHHQSIANSNGYLRTCSVSEWGAVHNDAGSTIVASTDEDVLIALFNGLNGKIGDAIGQYSSTDPEVDNQTAIATVTNVGALISSQTTSMYGAAYEALVKLSENLAIVTPSDGFYRLKNASTGKYLRVISAEQGGIVADVEAANAASTPGTIVKIETSGGHQFYNCQSREFRQCYYTQPITAGYGTHDKYALYSTKGIANQLAIAFAYGNGTGDYAANVEGAYYAPNDDNIIVGGASTAAAAQWIFEEVETVTISLNSDGADSPTYYATLCAPFSYTVGEGTTAYTLEQSGEWLVPTEVDGTVAAGTPVLLKGSSETATLTISSGYSATPLATTDLTGTYLATSIDATANYVFGKYNGKVGFYHVDNDEFSLKANRAYLSVASAARGFALMFDDVITGIVSTLGETEEGAAIYNISGQRLNKMQKGINIVNGKKVLF